VRVIFSSYGNDSCALIQWTYEQQRLRDWRIPVVVAYSDTGWASKYWSGRVSLGEEWARSLGFATERIFSEGMKNLVRRKKAWPRGGGGKFQFCTMNLKEQPALAWLARADPDADAICMIGIRREESRNRATFPEWTEDSPRHGGRSLHAPLVTYTAAMRDELLRRTPFKPLPHRSKECWPCVNARKTELRLLDLDAIERIEDIERDMGTNSKGNERVMFSPKRHGGAVGIREVVEDALKNSDDIFAELCDGGWCAG
jgi:3'-phosphoadenosine 5'-phosphosulfate sulfotransferase (PAPS reductase)/FAD synthetase